MIQFTVTSSLQTVNLPNLLNEVFGLTKSEARRIIDQNGVSIDGQKVPKGWYTCCRGDIEGKVLRAGKRKFVRIAVTEFDIWSQAS